MNTGIKAKIHLCYIYAFLCVSLFLSCPTEQCYAMSQSEVNISDTESSRATNIYWRYQKINNVLYKRLYNYDTEQWIGDWIKVS